jgi:hypothetical protein
VVAAVGDCILDSTILVDLSLGHAGAVAFASSRPGSRFIVHLASEAEVLVWSARAIAAS